MLRKLLGNLLYEIASVICSVAERIAPVYMGALESDGMYDAFDPAKFFGEDPDAYLKKGLADIRRMAAETNMPPQLLRPLPWTITTPDGEQYEIPADTGSILGVDTARHLHALPGEDENGEPSDPA